MSFEPGRNDACPCGSGKKYKRCCLLNPGEVAATGAGMDWKRGAAAPEAAPAAARALLLGSIPRDPYPERLRRMQALTNEVLEWSGVVERPPRRALRDFYAGAGGSLDEAEMGMFVSFLLWQWVPTPGKVPIGEAFVRARGGQLAPWEREYLGEALCQPWRFLEITAVAPGFGMAVRDVLTGASEQVREVKASQALRRGDIVFGQYVRVEGIVSLEALGTTALPPEFKLDLVRLRQAMERDHDGAKPGEAEVAALAPMMRALYFDLAERMRRPPVLNNTDGDRIEYHTLRYRIHSAEDAFAALAPLAKGEKPEELQQEGEFDAQGRLRAIELRWLKLGNRLHQDWENTVLGLIIIRGHTLTAELNSAKRAARLRREIERRLGEGAEFQSDKVVSSEAMMEKARRGPKPAPAPRDPELLAAEQQLMERHMVGWLDQELPILEGQTPRAVAQTPDGREMVAALLVNVERNQPQLARWARKELGLQND